MATIYLSLSKKENKIFGTREILVRFCHGRINQRSKSGIFIKPEYWDDGAQQINIPRFRIMSPDQRSIIESLGSIQQQISDLQAWIMSAFIDAGSGQLPIAKGWLDAAIKGFLCKDTEIGGHSSRSFFGLWDDFISRHHVSDQRIAMFNVVKGMLWRFERFCQIKSPSFSLSLDDLTADTLDDFESFLKNEFRYVEQYPEIYKGLKNKDLPKARGQNTISDRMSIFRTFVIWALKNDITTNDPFKKHEIKSAIYGTPIYISIDERNKLYNSNMPTVTLSIVRDIFVFQCLIGCRVGDLLRMTKDNVIKGAIEYIPRKTKEGRPVTVRVPLNGLAQEILEKYKDMDRKALLPFISVQRYNDYMKECFKIAGINRLVTVLNPLTLEAEQKPLCDVASSHMARRTFVGNLYKKVKDPNLVGSLSGHKEGSKAFARYRDIDEDMKVDLVKLLE